MCLGAGAKPLPPFVRSTTVEATHRQRILRAVVTMALGVMGISLAAFDPRVAWRDPAFYALAATMLAWTVAENLALQQDEPKDYRGKRNTRLLQGAVMFTAVLGALDRYHLPAAVLPRTGTFAAAGAIVILMGGALRITAIRTLAHHFRYELRVEAGQRVVDRGVFRHIRHPSYLGLLLIVIGEALTLSSLLALLVGTMLLLAILRARIREEEKVMLASFGEAYEEYRRRSWRLVPPFY